jgi:hypothetical protein
MYSLLSRQLLKQVEGVNSGTYMIAGIMNRNTEWVSADNGPATADFLELLEICDNMRADRIHTCYLYDRGTTEGLIPRLMNTAIETMSSPRIMYQPE